MTGYQMTGDSKPWFVRTCGRGGGDIRPSALAGWIVTGAYVGWAILISIFLLDDDPGLARWIAWAVLLAAGTILFALTVWRNSVSRSSLGDRARRERNSAGGSGRRRRSSRGD
jgi:hypothetical protein